MNVGVLLTVFAVTAVAELPDKTMIATLVMGSRSKPLLVWSGASAAFAVHVTVAVVAGRLLELLPHEVLEAIVTALFAAGAAYLLLVPDRSGAAEGIGDGVPAADGERAGAPADTPASATDMPASAADPPDRAPAVATGAWKVVATAFAVILVGEIGDITQLLTVNFVAHYHQPVAVFVGALAALIGVSAAGAFGGRALLRFVPVGVVRKVGGVALVGFAAYSLYGLLT